MREIATVLGGIGLLIFAYLLFTAPNVSSVFGAASSLLTNTITVLQGGGGNSLSGLQKYTGGNF
jgi:hypothetical protein